ncbi:MAG: sterol desaturase family protein [Deltaproteobacteria bacterium]|nr:sterol desaturase family protein [Deltaproteobacteria bacterium]
MIKLYLPIPLLTHLAAAAVVAVFVLLLILEALRPLRRLKRPRGRRFPINLSFTALAFIAGSLAVRPAALGSSLWARSHSFGLLNLLPLPFWVEVAIGILWLDLTFYYWHRLNHMQPLLWRFHNVHHVDPDLDVTTSFRFHFGEILYSTPFRVLQVGLLGISPATYLFYEFLFNCATMFHHSNVNLPVSLERLLNKLFVTPRMHGLHHSVIGRETNSNYSVVFSCWDRLNRSLRLNVPQEEVIIGVPGYLLPGDNRFFGLMTLPVKKQRPYWRWPSGKAPRRVYPAGFPHPGTMLE